MVVCTFTPVSKPTALYKIDPQGNVISLASDCHPLGDGERKRASEVEPNAEGGWDVTLTDHPLNGSHAGTVIASKVPTRKDALALEVAWINRHIIGKDARDGEQRT